MLRSALALVLAAPVAVLAVPASAAPPTCQGREATIVGTPGDDRLRGTSGPDVIVGRGGDDRIRGLAGDDVVCGGPGADTLAGGPGADALHGGAGALDGRRYTGDVVAGGPGADLLDPHAGPRPDPVGVIRRSDTVTYRDSRRAVSVDLDAGTARGEGADTIVPGIRLAVEGSRHDDVLVGSARREALDGGRGDDRVSGAAGADFLVADAGVDEVDAGPGGDFVLASRGDDTLTGGPGADFILAASQGPTSVLGGPGSDYVWRWFTPGPIGVLDAGPGRNQLEIENQLRTGETGERAELDRGAQTAVFHTGERSRTVDFSGFTSFILRGGDWTFTGSDEPDFVQVLDGRLEARGLGGDDWLMGAERNDVLDGGEGTDTAWGGGGRNTCIDVEEGECDGLPRGRVEPAPRDHSRQQLLREWWSAG